MASMSFECLECASKLFQQPRLRQVSELGSLLTAVTRFRPEVSWLLNGCSAVLGGGRNLPVHEDRLQSDGLTRCTLPHATVLYMGQYR